MKKRVLQTMRKLFDKSRQVRVQKETWLVLALCILAVAPSIVLHTVPVGGVYVNALSLILLVGLALLYEPARKVAVSAAIIPSSYMVVISLPQISDFTKAVCLYSSILILSLVYRYLFMQDSHGAKSQSQNSIRSFLAALPQAIVVGQVLAGLVYLLLPHVRPFIGTSIGLLLATAVVFALIETIFFQGLLQSTAQEVMSTKLAAIMTAVLFISLSSITSVYALVINVLAGSSFALIYYAKQSVLLTMLANTVMKLGFIYLIVIS